MADESSIPANQKVRASKRYNYKVAGVCDFVGDIVDIEITNISTGGIQIVSKTKIKMKKPVTIIWNDEKFGEFDTTFLLVREAHRPENKAFPYSYGAQYCNLNDETKQNLLAMLKSFKEAETLHALKQARKITTPYLMELIEQGLPFLKDVLTGKSTPYFENFIQEIKGYERDSFSQNTGPAKRIQKLVLGCFQLELAKAAVPLLTTERDFIREYLDGVKHLLQDLTNTENEVETELKKIRETESEQVSKQLQQLLNESSNRLFYAKQTALILIVKAFENSPAVEPIAAELKKMDISGVDVEDEAQTYARRTKMVDEQKIDKIVDVRIAPESRTKFYLLAQIILIGVILGVNALYKQHLISLSEALAQEIGIKTGIVKAVRTNDQVDVYVDDDWRNLSKTDKAAEYSKLYLFLRNDSVASTMVLMDKNGKLIQVLLKDTNFH